MCPTAHLGPRADGARSGNGNLGVFPAPPVLTEVGSNPTLATRMADALHPALEAALGGAPLTEALSVPAAQVRRVRDRAQTLFEAAKWRPCVTALEVLALLGDVGPYDALMRARCHTELGEEDLAARWAEVAQHTLTELDRRLGEHGDAR